MCVQDTNTLHIQYFQRRGRKCSLVVCTFHVRLFCLSEQMDTDSDQKIVCYYELTKTFDIIDNKLVHYRIQNPHFTNWIEDWMRII